MASVQCVRCASPVDVPTTFFLASSDAHPLLRAVLGAVRREPPLRIICAECTQGDTTVLRDSSFMGYVGRTATLAVILLLGAVFLVLYPLAGVNVWRPESLRWPQTDGGMLGALGVLATVLLAMGLELARLHEQTNDLRSPWRFGGAALDLGRFRLASRVFDRAELAEQVVLVTTAAAAAIGVVAVTKAYVTAHVESVVTAIVAMIVVVAGRVMVVHGRRRSRDDTGLERVAEIIGMARRRRVATAWAGAVGGRSARRAWLAGVALVLPVGVAGVAVGLDALDAGVLVGLVLLQVVGLAVLLSTAFTYAEWLTDRWGLGWLGVLCTPLLALMYVLEVVIRAEPVLNSVGWLGVGVWGVVLLATLGIAIDGVFGWTRVGGGFLALVASRVPRYRRARETPDALSGFFLVVTDEDDAALHPGAPDVEVTVPEAPSSAGPDSRSTS